MVLGDLQSGHGQQPNRTKKQEEPDVAVHTCILSTEEVGTEGAGFQGSH